MDQSETPVLLAETIAQGSFTALAWNNFGEESGDHPMGVIAGGFSDGTLSLWDP